MRLAPRLLEQAVEFLEAGKLVAFPTETVYGLGADAANPEAVAGIFAAKGRPADHPLIVHLADMSGLAYWATKIPQLAWDLAEAFWPGPLTLILKKQDWVPGILTGGQDTVGLRVPDHSMALELLAAFARTLDTPGRGGIAAPSANRFGRISPTTAAHVREELGERVALILDGGPCRIGIESTIVDLSRETPSILRPGHLGPEILQKGLGCLPCALESASAPRVSGSLASHYAPRTPARLLASSQMADFLAAQQQAHLCCGVLAHSVPTEGAFHFWQAMPAEPTAYAHELYGALRALDQRKAALIVIESPPDTPAWAAVLDRLRRAAFQKTAVSAAVSPVFIDRP